MNFEKDIFYSIFTCEFTLIAYEELCANFYVFRLRTIMWIYRHVKAGKG